jgi:lipoprotein NlpD
MKKLCLILLYLSLLACTSSHLRAPVETREGETTVEPARPSTHAVTGGDTLYGIAWRYGMDYRTLASVNNIPVPYTIYPGQLLSLDRKSAAAISSAIENPTTGPIPTSTLKPTPKPTPKPIPVIVSKPPSSPVTNEPPVSTQVSLGPVAVWRWPTKGKVVRKFSGTVHKGIDIGGKAGDPVKAVAPGMIVYSGSGIVGYGNLLIVKHNELYLSAYGHNRRLLVKEGEGVEAGQQIAEKGSSATNTIKLHFEIRRGGKPVDPKKLLPRR